MAYTTINKSTDYFNTKLYTGNGSAGHAITGVGFAPDWTWLKNRPDAAHHIVFDRVRGATKALYTNQTDAETTVSGHVTAFGSDGFTLGDNSGKGSTNENNKNYVAWNWKAGTTSGLSGGTITPSAYSINTTSGFGIYKYTGTGSAGTIAHGLGKVPKMIIIKPTSTTGNFITYHASIGNNKSIILNTTAAEYTSTNWDNTTPTSSVFNLRAGGDVNTSNVTYIAYVFCDVNGYSKVGSYTGNGNADGTFVYTGFKPAFILHKDKTNANGWHLHDNKRDIDNPCNTPLYPHSNIAEGSDTLCDFLSNGFKLRTNIASRNASGSTYIYMAFGQSLVGSNNIPCTAR